MQQVEVITNGGERELNDILRLELECFPAEWQYADARSYYREMLDSGEAINLFLVEGAERAGYLLAVPLASALDSLAEYDPEIEGCADCCYLESIQVLPEFRGKGGAGKLILAMCAEANRRGITTFSIHARTTNNLSGLVKRIFKGSILTVRPIAAWKFGGNEPYEYIVWRYAGNPGR